MATKKITTIKKTSDEILSDAKDTATKKKINSEADKKPKKAGSDAVKTRKKVAKVEEIEEDEKPRGPFVTPPPKPVVVPVAVKPVAVVPAPVAKPATPAPVKQPNADATRTPGDANKDPHLDKPKEPLAAQKAPANPAAKAPEAAAKPASFDKKQQPSNSPQRPHAPPAQKRFYPPPAPPAPKKEAKPVSPVLPKPSLLKPLPSAGSDSNAKRDLRKVKFNEMMTVKDLAESMNVKIADVIRKLLLIGTPATINQRIQSDVAALVADAFNCELDFKSIYEEEKEAAEEEKNLKPRCPVVTVMGHVDHGKTSLLDAIREAKVAAGEAGGITQHIGAYQVKTAQGVITFLDTPGHEAFTAMRARGANVTDLVVLVVAADDSVMPQTIEAIDHAKAANVRIVVAINKVDLPQANVQKVKQELAQHNLLAEDWGGKVVMVEVSAKTRKNIDKLLEMILLETELMELKANPDRPAKGVVLEAKMDPRRGVTATVLIQAGTLSVGDPIICGLTFGRVRAMLDERWKPILKAGPATPVAILGLSTVPQVGDQVAVVGGDREAREIVERRRDQVSENASHKGSFLSLETIHAQIEEGTLKELKIILKTDVQGSMQALQDSLGKLSTPSIQIRFVHVGIGNINESDVLLAEASNAIIFGFSVKVEGQAESEAKRAGVDIRTYQIIYEMLADVKAAMEGLLQPEEREVVKGKLHIKNVFTSSRLGTVAGCMVLEGKVVRGSKARLLRNGSLVTNGTISSLKRFKDDVKEVEKGFECGAALEGVRDYQPGDIIEVFVIEKHARRLEG